MTAATSAGSIQVSQANGTVTTSQSNISLRALGATWTLVLVNGRLTVSSYKKYRLIKPVAAGMFRRVRKAWPTRSPIVTPSGR